MDACQAWNAHLVAITSAEVNVEIRSESAVMLECCVSLGIIRDKGVESVWIGFDNVNGTWSWEDPGDAADSFQAWAPEQPSNTSIFARISLHGQWFSAAETAQFPIVCQLYI